MEILLVSRLSVFHYLNMAVEKFTGLIINNSDMFECKNCESAKSSIRPESKQELILNFVLPLFSVWRGWLGCIHGSEDSSERFHWTGMELLSNHTPLKHAQ